MHLTTGRWTRAFRRPRLFSHMPRTIQRASSPASIGHPCSIQTRPHYSGSPQHDEPHSSRWGWVAGLEAPQNSTAVTVSPRGCRTGVPSGGRNGGPSRVELGQEELGAPGEDGPAKCGAKGGRGPAVSQGYAPERLQATDTWPLEGSVCPPARWGWSENMTQCRNVA